MSRVIYFDCFSGASGDMILGAFIDAGLPVDALRQALGSLGVGHSLQVERVVKAGITATYVKVVADHHHHHGPHDHAGHSHADHGHRSLAEITHLIGHSSLSDTAKGRAVAMFRRLGEAEAAIHGMSIDEVHLHEVGAIDSIIDICAIAFAFEWLGIDDVVSSPLNVGSGSVEIAHGTFPVPAPATLRLLAGVPAYSTGIEAELVTPTGALVISTYARQFGPLPAMRPERVGYGAGTKDLGRVPNVLRVVIGERVEATAQDAAADMVRIECAIDDMSPQLFEPVSARLFAAGAVDVYLTAVLMKKGRPGTQVTVLAPANLVSALCEVLFRETTTIGVRFDRVEREVLDRSWVEVALPGGTVRIKLAGRGGEIYNAMPEFDDCVRIADATGQSVKAVQSAALQAWHAKSGT